MPRWSSAYNKSINHVTDRELEEARELELAAWRRMVGQPDEDIPPIETRFDEIRFAKELRGD